MWLQLQQAGLGACEGLTITDPELLMYVMEAREEVEGTEDPDRLKQLLEESRGQEGRCVQVRLMVSEQVPRCLSGLDGSLSLGRRIGRWKGRGSRGRERVAGCQGARKEASAGRLHSLELERAAGCCVLCFSVAAWQQAGGLGCCDRLLAESMAPGFV